jgi:hypothetical protein
MKLDLLTNATVVDDAIRFVSSNKSKDNQEKQIGRVIQKLEDPNTISLWAEIPKEQEENVDYSERFSPSI